MLSFLALSEYRYAPTLTRLPLHHLHGLFPSSQHLITLHVVNTLIHPHINIHVPLWLRLHHGRPKHGWVLVGESFNLLQLFEIIYFLLLILSQGRNHDCIIINRYLGLNKRNFLLFSLLILAATHHQVVAWPYLWNEVTPWTL